MLESKAPSDNLAKAEYNIAKEKTEGYKEPLKSYLAGEISIKSFQYYRYIGLHFF